MSTENVKKEKEVKNNVSKQPTSKKSAPKKEAPKKLTFAQKVFATINVSESQLVKDFALETVEFLKLQLLAEENSLYIIMKKVKEESERYKETAYGLDIDRLSTINNRIKYRETYFANLLDRKNAFVQLENELQEQEERIEWIKELLEIFEE